jgi:hypothetical protein
MRTWVNHEVGNAQQLTALQFIQKGLNGFFVQGLVRRRQVDEIGAVSDDRADASRLAGVAEDGDFGGRQRLGLPLVGVLGEDLIDSPPLFYPIQDSGSSLGFLIDPRGGPCFHG